ncbi:MAG: HAD hydrolase-like protein [Spirochaetales bacterium]|nr:HAD hydrolase-like protein [Spirochaetales bacterium]
MKYKCLILDHDDTSVKSTEEIHYPAYLETMKNIRPELEPLSLEGWIINNFSPGVLEYFRDILGFSNDEIQQEFEIWKGIESKSNPHFFPGMIDLIKSFQKKGGIVAVVSHSVNESIKRHYEVNGDGALPDVIYGWDFDPEKRKPSVWPVQQIIDKYKIIPSEILMVDDLKPGLTMAKNSGIDIAGAGWGHDVPQVREYMQEHCNYYFDSIEGLSELIK